MIGVVAVFRKWLAGDDDDHQPSPTSPVASASMYSIACATGLGAAWNDCFLSPKPRRAGGTGCGSRSHLPTERSEHESCPTTAGYEDEWFACTTPGTCKSRQHPSAYGRTVGRWVNSRLSRWFG